jgi:O-antigen ligase
MPTVENFDSLLAAERRPPVVLLMALMAALAIGPFIALSSGSVFWLIPAAAIGGACVLLWFYRSADRDAGLMVCALLLVEMLVSTSFVGGDDETGGSALRTGIRYGLILLLCLPFIPKVWSSGIWRRGGFYLYCFYYFWCAVTIVYSLAPAFSAARLALSIAIILALSLAVARVERAEDARRLVGWFVVGSAILTLLLTASLALPHSISWGVDTDGGDRFQGFLPSPNQVGALMVTTVGAALYWAIDARWPQRIALAFLIVAALALAALADSRTGFGAIGVGITLFMIWRYRWRGLFLCLLLFGALAGAIVLRGAQESVTRGNVTTLTNRTEIWRFAVSQIAENPILGYGFDVEGAIYQSRYFPLWYGPWDLGPYSSIHNGYLARMVGVGIPAMLLWLFITLRPMVFALRSDRDPWKLKPLAMLVVVPILIEAMAETLVDGRGSTGILLFLAWALLECQRLAILAAREREQIESRARMPRAIAALSA